MIKYRDIAIESLVGYYEEQHPLDLTRLFSRQAPIDVEIGFGLGEFLIRSARQYPERNFVGIEQDWIRIKKTLRTLFLLEQSGQGLHNIRILKIDAKVAFERLFSCCSINRIYSLFPCPWPKKSHIKYRLFSNDCLRLFNSRLIQQGELKIVTDYFPYVQWILEHKENTGFDVKNSIIQPQYDTKYERKWRGGGQKEFFELLFTKQEHIDIPLEEDAEVKNYYIEYFDADQFQLKKTVNEISIIYKDYIFDAKKNIAMVHVVVAEKSLTQHLWIMIIKCAKGWCIKRAEGQTVLPTKGVLFALHQVYVDALNTRSNNVSHRE